MKKPSYTNFPIYEILEDLSSKAGIKIEYGKLPKNVFGKCFNDERKIIMSDTNVYCSNKDEDGKNNASFILAHEIAHAIINNLYFFNEYDYDGILILSFLSAICKRSLSPETTTGKISISRAFLESVPKISSASKPSFS